MPSSSGKGFTLAELMIVITIIGILTLMATNIDFGKKTDIEKQDRITTKLASMINATKMNMSSGKWVAVTGTAIINPSQTEILFSSGSIITRYYSWWTVIGTGDTLTSPFFWDTKYTIAPLYYTDKTLANTGSLSFPMSILYDTDWNISFSGSNVWLTGSVLVSLQAGYQTSLKTFEFDRRGFGRITIR